MENSSRKLSILLIEDNAADIYLFQAALRDIAVDADVHVFDHGTQAWEYLSRISAPHEKKPDLIILDLNLPGMSGRDILREISTNKHLNNMLVAVFSGAADEGAVTQEFPELSVMFAAKTYLYDELKNTLRQVCAFANRAPVAAGAKQLDSKRHNIET